MALNCPCCTNSSQYCNNDAAAFFAGSRKNTVCNCSSAANPHPELCSFLASQPRGTIVLRTVLHHTFCTVRQAPGAASCPRPEQRIIAGSHLPLTHFDIAQVLPWDPVTIVLRRRARCNFNSTLVAPPGPPVLGPLKSAALQERHCQTAGPEACEIPYEPQNAIRHPLSLPSPSPSPSHTQTLLSSPTSVTLLNYLAHSPSLFKLLHHSSTDLS
jgi:hypothetical protein